MYIYIVHIYIKYIFERKHNSSFQDEHVQLIKSDREDITKDFCLK